MSFRDEIRKYQEQWFERIRPFLLETNLNVGSGLGYFSEIAERKGLQVVSLEVAVHLGAVNAEETVIYDGVHMPFEAKSFKASVAMYVLHHAPDRSVVLNEMKRVSEKRIVLVEELYRGLLGKLRLAALDFWVNLKLRQKSDLYWQSYFNEESFRAEAEKSGWSIVEFERNRKFGFDEVLCVLEPSVG